MTILNRYLQIKNKIQELRENMRAIEESPDFQREKDFLNKLRDLMNEYGKTTGEVIVTLSPKNDDKETNTKRRRKRKLKIYKHPETGDVVETRGGNNKTLKVWKAQYGSEIVDSWLIEEK